MWNLLEKNDKECRKLRDLLEDSALARPEAARIEELSETWAAAEHNHLAACNRCQTAAQESLFEAPPPVNLDDVLVPVQENNP